MFMKGYCRGEVWEKEDRKAEIGGIVVMGGVD